MKNGEELLAEYVETNSEAAFQELVARYVDLVYSAAVRLVNGDTHRAEDVAQTVFADLARMARTLSKEVRLGGWLHRHTCFVANNTMRGERRRQFRERQAVEMNAPEDHSVENLAMVAPVLDEAIDKLGAEDRAAIVLRFFEQKDFRSVGETLGSNEEAARKRVNRALDKLHGLLKQRGVAFSATALAMTLTTEAVTAAPAGLAMTISGAALASAATGGGTTLAILKIMTMTKLKVGVIVALVAGGVAIPLMMQHQAQSKLREENEALRQSAEQSKKLAAENERLKLASQSSTPEPTDDKAARELVKLRGEVGKLRTENANVTAAANAKPTGASMLSEMATNAEMKKLIRDQQKMGMAMMYGKFGKDLKLSKEDGEKLNNLLADDVMENVDHIMAILHDGSSPAEQEQIFAQQDSALLEKVGNLIGQENISKYQEYTRDMASHLTTEQFKGELTGDKAAKEAKAKQLYEVMQSETRAALANAGLDPNFQTVPMMNFRNIASETEAEKNLKLLDGIYGNVASQASAFLSPAEIKKFQEFQSNAINASRMALVMNRKMMSPSK
jgi:RNA polymerase sigma factor (sigma-70 family)